MLIIGHSAVRDILAGREMELIDEVRAAYLAHHEGRTVVPHSLFLRFPDRPRDRVIALPAYLGGAEPVAGIKWISSFPGNLDAGLPRASAAMILNSLENGRPEALVEASLISAKRTAASAALAATLLTTQQAAPTRRAASTLTTRQAAPTRRTGLLGVGLVGCGVVNLEIVRFLAAAFPSLSEVVLYDTDPGRAAAFAEQCASTVPVKATVTAERDEAVGRYPLVSIATTAATPHMDLAAAAPGAVVLHVSLRDLTTDAILASHNVVDDADHVCREATSLHLTEQVTGDRSFINASIGEMVAGTATVRAEPDRPVVFSPFGLGVLDVALARFVRTRAQEHGLGLSVPDFLPGPASCPAQPT